MKGQAGLESAILLNLRSSFFEKGSVESTHKVPTSHYRTKHCHAAVVPLLSRNERERNAVNEGAGRSRVPPPRADYLERCAIETQRLTRAHAASSAARVPSHVLMPMAAHAPISNVEIRRLVPAP